MRLQKYLALCGVASRRHAEEMIASGLVKVNGQVITQMGFLVNENDIVCVRDEVVKTEAEKRYILYHKPMGEVTTVSDERGRETVMDHFRDFPVRLYPIGRLDYDSEGLLLLTNDGELTAKLTHPRHEVKKTYLARITTHLLPEDLHLLRSGVVLDDGFRTSPASVRVISEDTFASNVIISIHEGHNRQVRRMMEAVGHKVLLLRRIKFGPIELHGVERGEWRDLTEEEIRKLKEL